MPTTASGIVYPSSTDDVDVPGDMQAMANSIEPLIGPRGIMADPISTSTNGTVTAANLVEVRDAVLGNYTFTAVTGRRYKVYYIGCKPSTNSGTGLVSLRVRLASGTTPTTSSTLILDKNVYVAAAGGGGQEARDLVDEFTATSGSWSLSAFLIGNNTVTTPVGTRKLWVEDIGPS